VRWEKGGSASSSILRGAREDSYLRGYLLESLPSRKDPGCVLEEGGKQALISLMREIGRVSKGAVGERKMFITSQGKKLSLLGKITNLGIRTFLKEGGLMARVREGKKETLELFAYERESFSHMYSWHGGSLPGIRALWKEEGGENHEAYSRRGPVRSKPTRGEEREIPLLN